MEGDFLPRYRKVKKEIMGCVTEQLSVLEDEVLFEARSGAWNCNFKLGKRSSLSLWSDYCSLLIFSYYSFLKFTATNR
jgi:hypothetical protein